MEINDGIGKNTAPLSMRITAASLRIMGNVHPNPLNPNPKCYGHLQAPIFNIININLKAAI